MTPGADLLPLPLGEGWGEGRWRHPADTADASQTVKAQMRLRELIVGGLLAPGERVPELALVERLGVSRTPVRTALHKLTDEGLLDALPGGGHVVKAFGEAEVRDAIEVRGTLEGLAARLAAERGAAASLLTDARSCLLAIDALLQAPALDETAIGGYVVQNAHFHALLAEMSGSAVVRRQIERAAALPFASPNSFVLQRSSGPGARDTLVVAQQQHRAVVVAIERREGGRAEALMREHARIAEQNLGDAMASRSARLRSAAAGGGRDAGAAAAGPAVGPVAGPAAGPALADAGGRGA